MTPDEELLAELKKINHKLDKFTSFWKNSWWNFYSGIFRSLGSMFGTAVIAAIIFYFLSQLNLVKIFESYFQKLMPSPQVNFSLPFSPPSPDQP